MDYFTHIASKSQPKPAKPENTLRRDSRDAYQMHGQRFTAEQLANAARLARGLRLS